MKANLRGFTLVEQSNRIKTMRLKGECLHISISHLFLPGIFRSDKGNFIIGIFPNVLPCFYAFQIFRGYCLHSENQIMEFVLFLYELLMISIEGHCNLFVIYFYQFLSSAVKHWWLIIFDKRNRLNQLIGIVLDRYFYSRFFIIFFFFSAAELSLFVVPAYNIIISTFHAGSRDRNSGIVIHELENYNDRFRCASIVFSNVRNHTSYRLLNSITIDMNVGQWNRTVNPPQGILSNWLHWDWNFMTIVSIVGDRVTISKK